VKISIWQGFSSNHSSRFTVVGVFSTPEHAQDGALIVTSLLRKIFDWYHQPENADALAAWEGGGVDPAPIELAMAEQLGIPWPEFALDWLWFGPDGQGPVKVLDSLVFIDGSESELGAHPADYLIQLVGGQPLIDGYVEPEGYDTSRDLVLTLTCTAKDEAAAEAIEAETLAYSQKTNEHGSPGFDAPWMANASLLVASAYYGGVRRVGSNLQFTGTFWRIGNGFPALVAWLRARGCTDVHYEFTEKSERED
jgi:hypothetical protein